jgi:hypothetical protein
LNLTMEPVIQPIDNLQIQCGDCSKVNSGIPPKKPFQEVLQKQYSSGSDPVEPKEEPSVKIQEKNNEGDTPFISSEGALQPTPQPVFDSLIPTGETLPAIPVNQEGIPLSAKGMQEILFGSLPNKVINGGIEGINEGINGEENAWTLIEEGPVKIQPAVSPPPVVESLPNSTQPGNPSFYNTLSPTERMKTSEVSRPKIDIPLLDPLQGQAEPTDKYSLDEHSLNEGAGKNKPTRPEPNLYFSNPQEASPVLDHPSPTSLSNHRALNLIMISPPNGNKLMNRIVTEWKDSAEKNLKIEDPSSKVANSFSAAPLVSETPEAAEGTVVLPRFNISKMEHLDLIQRIGGKISWSLRNNEEKIRLALEPPQLGNLLIEIHRDKEQVKAILWVDNSATKDILESSQLQLQKILEGDGFKLGKYEVFVQKDMGSFQGNDRDPVSQERGHQGNPLAQPDSTWALPSEMVGGITSTGWGSRYVDLFV